MSGKYKAVASSAITNGKPVIAHTDGTVKQVAQTSISSAGGTPVEFQSDESSNISTTFDSNANKIVMSFINQDGSNDGTSRVGTINASDNSVSFGTAAEYTTNYGTYVASAFDSNSNKVVVAYRDHSNSSYGTAAVGTVSGTNISFGTPVVFESAGTAEICVVFDNNSNKIVIVYYDEGNSSYGTAVVGTVSGTGISFGTPAVWETGGPNWLAATFDSNSNKVVISYNLAIGAPSYAGQGTAIVGTVSGTGISFGSSAAFRTRTTSPSSAFEKNASCFDSNSNKVVLVYEDKRGGGGNAGQAIVGTVSGTNISFGTPVYFGPSETVTPVIIFDSVNNKVIVAYGDTTNSTYLTAKIGTVSGTDISFGSAIVLTSIRASNGSEPFGGAFDPNTGRAIFGYKTPTSDQEGLAVVFRPASLATNLTSENYIGIASGGTYADTAEATIDIVGAVNKDQTSLTAGQTYFVQTNGTLGTSADDPSVVAGTAISATELIVKG